MKELFLSYELSLLAKEKGFDAPCLAGYNIDGEFAEPDYELAIFRNHNRSGGEISAPLYQQVIDFLRDRHSIYINQSAIIGEDEVTFSVTCNDKNREIYADTFGRSCVYFNVYYGGLKNVIQEGLNLIP